MPSTPSSPTGLLQSCRICSFILTLWSGSQTTCLHSTPQTSAKIQELATCKSSNDSSIAGNINTNIDEEYRHLIESSCCCTTQQIQWCSNSCLKFNINKNQRTGGGLLEDQKNHTHHPGRGRIDCECIQISWSLHQQQSGQITWMPYTRKDRVDCSSSWSFVLLMCAFLISLFTFVTLLLRYCLFFFCAFFFTCSSPCLSLCCCYESISLLGIIKLFSSLLLVRLFHELNCMSL